MTNVRLVLALFFLAIVAGCAAGRQAVPGVAELGEMRVTFGDGWIITPGSENPDASSLVRSYSHGGLPADRITLVAGVRAGRPILDGGMLFGLEMDVEQTAAMLKSSLPAFDELRGATIETSNAREHGFAGVGGTLVDMTATTSAGQTYRGQAGGFVHEERFYAIFYHAQDPGAYQATSTAAMEIINSSTVRVKTTGRF